MNQVMVSVVMSVYNGEKYLDAAIKSVLDQTYHNWEMIIVNDASTDSTASILEKYRQMDSRIKVLTNETNKKLPMSLNYGISAAKGKYIVRMDADDICISNRLETQVNYMEEHSDIDVSWGLFYELYDGVIRNSLITYSVSLENTKASLLLWNVVYHPGVIMRKSLFDEYAYEPEYTITEDLKLWMKIAQKHKIQGMRDYVMMYRKHAEQATNPKNVLRQKEQVERIYRNHFAEINWDISEDELAFHMDLLYGTDSVKSKEYLVWVKAIVRENAKHNWCEKRGLYYTFLWKIDELCRNKRMTKSQAFISANKISILAATKYMIRKMFTAAVDLGYRQKGKKNI